MPRPEHLPFDLLETFIAIVDSDGAATTAAEQLEISQPSISKRLSALRRMTSDPDGQPWLLLKGRRWIVTSAGQRVRGVVRNLVHRYQEMEEFVSSNRESQSVVSIACGQDAATSFVKAAIEQLLKIRPSCRIRLSTPRGKARIEGVAGGQFDLAIVTDSPASIRRAARVDLFVKTLFEDHFVLVANPPAKSNWHQQWSSFFKVAQDRGVNSREIIGLPFIVPESDSSRRKQFDEWTFRVTGQLLDVVLETGGWQNILDFAASGLGVGLVTQSSLDGYSKRHASRLTSCKLSTRDFPPDAVRLITRKVHGEEEAELTEVAKLLATELGAAVIHP